MHQFNQTMDYLEQQLTGEVDMKRFQQLSGYSYPVSYTHLTQPTNREV